MINPWGEVTHEPSPQSPETSFSLTLKFETTWTLSLRTFVYSLPEKEPCKLQRDQQGGSVILVLLISVPSHNVWSLNNVLSMV